MTHPRHIWSGDWRSESEAAREAAEKAERLKQESRANAAASAPPPAAEPIEFDPDAEPAPGGWQPRRGAIALTVLSVLGLIAGAFAVGTLTGGSDNNNTAALPAVANSPIKPKKGQTQASAIYAAASPAVVSIRTGSGSGTGFLIDSNGTIVTNAHVAGGAHDVAVRFGQNGVSLAGKVRGTDPSAALAVVDIPPSDIPKGVKPLQFADSRSVQVGDMAIAIGNP